MKKNLVSCFDIGEVPRSPGNWNWNWLYFLPFIFTFEQGEGGWGQIASFTLMLVPSEFSFLLRAWFEAAPASKQGVSSIFRHLQIHTWTWLREWAKKTRISLEWPRSKQCNSITLQHHFLSTNDMLQKVSGFFKIPNKGTPFSGSSGHFTLLKLTKFCTSVLGTQKMNCWNTHVCSTFCYELTSIYHHLIEA